MRLCPACWGVAALVLSVLTMLPAEIPPAEKGRSAADVAHPPEAPIPPAHVDRHPRAVAVSPDRGFALTANATSATVSLVDLTGWRVVQELIVGEKPDDVIWIDGSRAAVSMRGEDVVALLEFRAGRLTVADRIAVGDEPRGMAVLPLQEENPTRDGNRKSVASAAATSQKAQPFLLVAVSGFDQVAVVDLALGKVVRRLNVGGLPSGVAVSPDGRWIVTSTNVPGEVFVHDASTWQQVSRRRIFDDAFNLGAPIVPADSASCLVPHVVNRTFPIHESNIEKGWAIDNRLSRLPLPSGRYWEQKQLGLDVRGNAAGDPQAIALSPEEQWLVVTCGGSHELLIFRYDQLEWPPADPGDFIPYWVLQKPGLFRRVELGGRPMEVAFVDERQVLVANQFLNALQWIDVTEGKLLRSLSLGGPDTPSLARKGEWIFHDADRSFDSWFSCATCHTEGHTSGQTFDTTNDGNYDTFKLVPSLRGVTKTGPWTWHGWQTDLRAAMRKSLNDTLCTKMEIREEDIDALLAYLATLEAPPSPHRLPDGTLTPQARRGKALFEGKAGCSTCHAGRWLTTDDVYTVGLESERYAYQGFNPPSLRGLHARRRFLHDGRAESLEEVLTKYHRPEDLAGERLTQDELRDLMAWLKSL